MEFSILHKTKLQEILLNSGMTEVNPVIPYDTSENLLTDHSNNIKEFCKELKDNPSFAHIYKAHKKQLAIITNGSFINGIGNIGPEAARPLAELKSVIFKEFSDIDAFCIPIAAKDKNEIISTIKHLEPAFCGIHLENIKHPDCFDIENALKTKMDIPVFHGDLHGIAIISGAVLLNACKISGRSLKHCKIVVLGTDATAIACSRLYVKLGIPLSNIFMFDDQGLVFQGREDIDPYIEYFAQPINHEDIAICMQNADILINTTDNIISLEMIRMMDDNPIILILNKNKSEISISDIKLVRQDAIIATYRNGAPNEINPDCIVPCIFRGAIDTCSSDINDEMKISATHAFANLAHDKAPRSVLKYYGIDNISLGHDYLIPKPLDPRILTSIACSIARAAMKSGVAAYSIDDFEDYSSYLRTQIQYTRARIRSNTKKIQTVQRRYKKTRKICGEGRLKVYF